MWGSKATILATILVLGSGCAAQAHRAHEEAPLPALPHTEAPPQIEAPLLHGRDARHPSAKERLRLLKNV